MRIKGLVWLGIPVDSDAAAVQFFTQALGLKVAFDEAGTMELSAKNDDRIQLFGPGHRTGLLRLWWPPAGCHSWTGSGPTGHLVRRQLST
jgi:hypothetical protein